MCDKCKELDEKIERCRRLSTLVIDKITLEGIDALIWRYEGEKRALHSEQN
jgi:hypothetical protein